MATIRTSFAAAALAASALALQPAAAQAVECGTSDRIRIAEMTWLSAATLAHITHRILADGYGCNAVLVPGDTVPTATTMFTRSEPEIAPELWISTAEAIWLRAQEKGNVYKASDIFADGGQEGWWIPDYVAEANPTLKSIEDLKDHAHLFAEPANPNQGRLYGCPPGWGCEIITNNLFEALNLGETFELFSPGSGENLKASIARKVIQQEPIVAYYWAPTDIIGKFNLVRLDMPEYDAEKFTCLTDANCENPQVTGWAVGEVAVAVTTELRDKAPAVAEFLSKLQLPNDTVNQVLAWGDDNRASPEEVAEHFFKTEPGIWTAWVPAEVAAKVKASLN